MIIKDNKELSNKVRIVNGVPKECQQILKIINGTEHVIWGGGKIIPLGTGTSFDIKSIYPKYRELTADNFMFSEMSSASGYDRVVVQGYTRYVVITGDLYKSYDAQNGILTMFNACGNTTNLLACNKGAVKVYLIVKPEKLTYLGYGRTFDLKNISGYENFTKDNFLISTIPWHNGSAHYIINDSRTYDGTWEASGNTSFSKSYSNGILNVNYRLYGETPESGGDTWNMGAHVYLVKKGV